ncbi:MAG TPA: MFS transporter [Steroidobacteraceae bacterium]|nr:MFS transporter [Steroidobacteraceae bacterium]
MPDSNPLPSAQQTRRILFASLIGTTIEFFDFYIYATAAVLVFPKLFFPKGDPASAMLQSLATFALAFFARPIGSALFGHFGDRIGRKATLVTALLTMGISTVVIGLLPTYASIGVPAAGFLALCRLGQGLGLGGEWGGAVLLATENAPPGRHAWYGMFPQLGAPLGFLCSTGVFLALSNGLSEVQFLSWGWRVPFLASAVLVLVGLYVRLQLVETPAFKRSIAQGERVRVPIAAVVAKHLRQLVLGTLGSTCTFVVFYLMTVFALSWATSSLGFGRQQFLILQMLGVLFFGATIPVSAIIADRIGGRAMLMLATLLIIAFGFAFKPLFGAHASASVLVFLALGFGLSGLTYGPLGSALAALFPTAVRYTGTSLTFNLAGILGASLAPSIATSLALHYGVASVGYYLSAAGIVSLIALLLIKPETPGGDRGTNVELTGDLL